MAAFRIMVSVALLLLYFTEAQEVISLASRQKIQDFRGYLGGYPYSNGYYGGPSPYSSGFYPYNYPYGAYSGYPGGMSSNPFSSVYNDYPYSGFYGNSGQYY